MENLPDNITVFRSTDASLSPETREQIIGMNRREETLMRQRLEAQLSAGEIYEEEAVEECARFMRNWLPGQRVFPVLPDYVKELLARIEASTAT